MERIVTRIAATFGAVAMFVGSAWAADITLTEDTEWLDGRALSGMIDLNGHKLTVSSLTGNATIMNSADAGYEILEYLESSGNAYVNTGVKVAPNTVIDIKFRLLRGGSAVSYVGARQGDASAEQFGGWISADMYHVKAVSASQGASSLKAAVNADYTVHLDKNGPCTVDGVEFTTGSGVGNDLPITVFCLNQANVPKFFGEFRVYSCTIKYGSEVQRNLKPARRLSDGALGLLDVANQEFYPNANSSGAFRAGPVASDELAHPAELHVAVAGGTTDNATVAITGPVRLVKEGAGTFVATRQEQTYTGGTDVTAGTFRCGNGGYLHVYGADGSQVTVREGATFDCDGWADHAQFRFVLDGGTLKNEKDRGSATSGHAWFGDMTLTKDSVMDIWNCGFVGSGYAECILRMNEHTLTVDVGRSKGGNGHFYMLNLKVEGGGEIYGRVGGFLALGGNPNGNYYVKAETTTLRVGTAAIYDAGTGEHVFGSYVSEHVNGWDSPKTAIKVKNRFVPGIMWHSTELQDGATLDLSAYDSAWSTTCEFPKSEVTAKATFAANATIHLDLGERVPVGGMKLIGWTDADKPSSGVKFKLPDTISSDDFMLQTDSDGLYVVATVKKATWSGAAGTADCTDPKNWTCYDANDHVIDGARPGSVTDVTVTGRVHLDIPANTTFSCASFTCDNVSLADDCDWSGLKFPLSSTIDLNGHKLTVSSLTGDATITSSADAGYEILEYIESDGKAYVNTGVAVADNTVIDIKVRLLKDSKKTVSYVGARVGDATPGQLGGWISADLNHFRGVSAKQEKSGLWVEVNKDFTAHLNKSGSCTIDGVEFATGSGGGNQYPITVFCLNQANEPVFIGELRVYFCTIAYGSEVQRDLKPARRLSDGALGLLDVANQEFYPNANSSGAFRAGPVASDELAHPAELHVAVASGTTENSTVAIAGPVRFVKEGNGTFVAVKQGQTYNGGTDIKAGTFRCGNGGNLNIYGAAGSAVTVREGATFDCDGWADHAQFPFVLDGGTVKTTRDRGSVTSGHTWFADMTLTKDSVLYADNSGFVGSGYAECILRMNDHKLTVNVSGSGNFYMLNLKVVGGGEIYGGTGGWFALGGNPYNPNGNYYVRAETTTLRMTQAAIKDGGTGEHVFGSYVSEHVNGWDSPLTAIKVKDRFVPGIMWHSTELQDGATLDLSACGGAWSTTCEFPKSEVTAKATFAKGATIYVDLGERKVKSSEPIVTWAAKPENVKFLSISGAKGKFAVKEDGLYWNVGFSVIIH